jgi:hypothetical protein
MAGNKSAYFERAMLDLALSAITFTPPATLYLALSTSSFSTSATGSVMNEVSVTGTAYARVAITANLTNFPAASGSNPATKSNGTVFTFPTATAAWGTILSAYLVDASTGGSILYGADLTASKVIQTGDTATYAVGALTITEL